MTGLAGRLALATLLCWIGLCAAQSPLQPVPPLTAHVVDQAGLLDAASKAELERKLSEFEARKGSQVAVLVVATTAPEAIEPYALRAAEQWRLGRKTSDDGAVLVVARDDRALRIEVGYGLEGALNDATCKRIIDEVIVPRFQQGDFAGGITAGVDRMLKVIDGESLPPPQPSQDTDFGSYVPGIVVLALVLGALLRSLFGKLAGSAVTGGLVGAVTWWMAGGMLFAVVAGVMAMLVNLAGGARLLRGLGGFGGGRRGGGGGMTGGGGGFGGGGASGKW